LSKYRVVYTEVVVLEVLFEGPDDMNEDQWWEHSQEDPNAQEKRMDVCDREIDKLEKVE
jgi:hypothetical protein